MHPTTTHHLAQARTAGLRHQAQRDALARAARRERPDQRGHAAPGSRAAGRRVRRRPSPRTVLAIASLGSAVAFVDATIVNIAFPDIARSFPAAPISTLSWVLNAYNIVFAAFLLAAAGIADLLGRRRVFVFGLGLFTTGSLLCAIAPSADALIAFRVVQALGAAFLVPSALALVLNAFPPAHRRHGVALLSAVGAAAAGFGPSLGGLLVTAALAVLDPPDWPGAHRRPGRRGGGGRTGESAGPAHRTPGRPRGGGPAVGRGGAVVRRASRGDPRLRRPVAAGDGAAGDRRGHAVPGPVRHRGRLGAG